MNNKFDELAKGMAQSVTRRGAFKKFGVGIAGIALTAFGFVNEAEAQKKPCLPSGYRCRNNPQCCSRLCIDGICE